MRMTDEEVKQYLDEPRIARVASNNPSGYPYLVATWYAYEDCELYFFCGRRAPRASALQEDPKMVFLIDDDHYPYKHVTIHGIGHLEESQARTDEYVERISIKYLGPDMGMKYAESLKELHRPGTDKGRDNQANFVGLLHGWVQDQGLGAWACKSR